jgi:ABC-type sugar transport system ATPase subunit
MAGSVSSSTAIEVTGLRKAYGGIHALTGMDLAVEAGIIHAVVGENGAGKSTLMKILAGAVQPDDGELFIAGEPVRLGSPADARAQGVNIVYQELSLLPDRSILANLFLDNQPTRMGIVDRGQMRRRARPVLDRVGLAVDVDESVASLGIGERQLVELSRVLIARPRVLILDEPNSALNERETSRLFGILRELSANEITIIYVSHRLEEVFAIADRITVMRNGNGVLTSDRAATSIPRIVEAMIGASQAELFPPRPPRRARSDRVLVADGLTVEGEIDDISFEAYGGEVIGLAGLEGSGIATLLGVLFGTRQATAGRVVFPDGAGLPSSPTVAARRGISLVPSDRRHQGLMLEQSITTNVSQVAVGTAAMRAAAQRQIDGLRIRADGPGTIVGSLSGGNQQKVVVGKWLEVAPSVFLLDDPTRGVDVGAKQEIYRLIRELADAGRIVIFRSTELLELVGLADHILVLYRGRLAGRLEGGTVDDHGLLHAINTGRLAADDASADTTQEVVP